MCIWRQKKQGSKNLNPIIFYYFVPKWTKRSKKINFNKKILRELLFVTYGTTLQLGRHTQSRKHVFANMYARTTDCHISELCNRPRPAYVNKANRLWLAQQRCGCSCCTRIQYRWDWQSINNGTPHCQCQARDTLCCVQWSMTKFTCRETATTTHQGAPLLLHSHTTASYNPSLPYCMWTDYTKTTTRKNTRTHTIQKSVSLANDVYWSMVDRTLNIKHISTIINLHHRTSTAMSNKSLSLAMWGWQ